MEQSSVATAPRSWSNIVVQEPEEKDRRPLINFNSAAAIVHTTGVSVGSCNSSKGIAVAVVDANAIIQGDQSLSHSADRFVSVVDVIDEIRDPSSRHFLNLMPFDVDTIEPSPDALKKVISFARATGDLQTLSDVDLKLIALTYTLESQIHGNQHLRDSPPPITTVNIKRLPEKDMPGWGSNVPNLEEWEALEHAFDNSTNLNSKILPVKDLDLCLNATDQSSTENVSTRDDNESHKDGDDGYRKPRKYFPKKIEVNLEGKKMVADGIDASQGQFDDNAGDWLPAVSRSTHRRYTRRKARQEMKKTLSELADSQGESQSLEKENLDNGGDDECPELTVDENNEPHTEAKIDGKRNKDENISKDFTDMKLTEESVMDFNNWDGLNIHQERIESNGAEVADTADEDASEGIDITCEELEDMMRSSHLGENTDSSQMDYQSSEQSWMLRSLSESSVACITSDFAMQNVILQMGLRLLAPGGKQIRELHRWLLKCHACYKVTTDIGRIFCPKCGNGGTLRKVAVTVSENGIILAGRRTRTSIRGTKFSLPFPQGGRNAVTKNPVLREDQLPQKFLYPKLKKKNNKQDDDFFVPDDVFRYHSNKNSHAQPMVRKTLAVFSGKRNPNDNHFSRPKY